MSESGDPALIGRTIAGKFVIEVFLGGGAMGAVYRARQAALEKDVAIKVMHRSVATDAQYAARFHREAKAASRLDHPNSMRVLDFGEEPDGLLYIAMEFVQGRDLLRLILEDWPLSNARIVELLSQALAAVAVAHDMGVIHRDLKPENIMVLKGKDDEGRDADVVKVCDFGIAKITEKDEAAGPGAQKVTTQGLVIGTPEYMSPEQAKGEKLDARSDIYSMGIILYQLLTGRTPFNAESALAVVLKHITDPPEPPRAIFPEVHPGLEAVCMQAIAKDRVDRFQSAREMRSAMRAALEGRPMPSSRELEPTMEAPASAFGTGPAPLASSPTVSAGVAPFTGAAVSMSRPALAPSVTQAPTSRSPLVKVAGVAAISVVVGLLGGLLWYMKPASRLEATKVALTEPTSTGPAPSPNPTTTTTATTTTTTPTATTERLPDRVAPKVPRDNREKDPARVPEPAVAVADPPRPADPPPVVATPEKPPEPKPIEKPVEKPAFNAQTCRAAVGRAMTSGSTSLKDLRGNPEAAWTACAKQMTEKASVSTTVTVQFNDNGQFRSANCASCPNASVANCVKSGARSSLALAIKGGDITGEPTYTFPVTFSCD